MVIAPDPRGLDDSSRLLEALGAADDVNPGQLSYGSRRSPQQDPPAAMHVKPFIIALYLCGCATESQVQLQRKLTQFEGGPVTAMIERFGPPSQQTEVDGQRWYVWSSSQESFALAYYMGYEGDSSYRAHCKISAEVHDGAVLHVRRDGNLEDCEWLGLI